MHEDFLSQPAGTFGAHCGADLKHQLPPQVLEWRPDHAAGHGYDAGIAGGNGGIEG